MREPLVLFHGATGIPSVWRHVVPHLDDEFEVHAPAALAHAGGRVPATRPIDLAAVIEDAEATLDELGLDAPHLAGNSLGGAIALELARRGRARTVCALSPAYTWEHGSADDEHILRFFGTLTRQSRATRPLMPLLMRSGRMRRYALQMTAVDGSRVTREDLIEAVDGILACDALADLPGSYAPLEALEPPHCPITIAWGGEDRVTRIDSCGANARRLFPGADFEVLPGVGHVPMFDDPVLVADAIRRSAHKADDPVDEPAGAEH